MSIKVRMTLLLGVLLVAFLGVLQIVRRTERNRMEELHAESVRAGGQTLWQWINLANQPLLRFVRDFSEWPELAAFRDRPDPAWAEANLKQNLANYDIHALWVVTGKGELLCSAQQNAGPPLTPPGVPADFPPPGAATGASPHFFSESRDGLLEVWAESIGPNREAPESADWLIVARIWNPRFLATLSRLSEMRVHLVPADGPVSTTLVPAQLRLPLRDLRGSPLRQLQATLPLPDFAATLAADTLVIRVLLLFGLLVIATVWLGVRRWVLHPLQQISHSLARHDVSPISALQHERNELGRVAQLVGKYFAQEQALQKSVEQVRHSLELRARLARDLHDGVIQSVYAAGLGLEGAMAELEQDRDSARARLMHCRQSLNSVIREVRGFINGLEPEQMLRRGFAAELAALVSTMQALRSARIAPNVDVVVAQQLSLRQEVQALQITRECISNALRHGSAKMIIITLAPDAGQAILTINDDGRGFDPAQVTGQGSGLKNIASRARELGGTLQVESQAGRGTNIRVTFPLGEAPP